MSRGCVHIRFGVLSNVLWRCEGRTIVERVRCRIVDVVASCVQTAQVFS